MKTRLFIVFITSLVISRSAIAQPVVFNDANLKAAVENALGNISNPTETDMLGLTVLDADYLGISDLKGLETAINLSWLNLSFNIISDISDLSELVNLDHLYLSGNNISDVSALSGLVNLDYINLLDNNISDISALSGLTKLTWLGLWNNNVSDISALSELINLEYLYLSGNNISDVSALSGLSNLGILDLSGNSLDCDAYRNYIPEIENNGVVVLNDPRTFTCPPDVSTYAAQQITGTSARLRGYLLDGDGEACEGRFRYWIHGQESQTEQTAAWQPITDNFSEVVEQLLPGTVYDFLIEARNSAGVGMGNQRTFITLLDPNSDSGLRAIPVNPGTEGLVAAYTFDADANDSSGNGYDGTLLGDATVQDGVLILDGDDDVVEIPAIGEANEVSYSMWVYPEANLVPLEFSGGINTNGWAPSAIHFKFNHGKMNVGLFTGLAGDLVGTTVVEPNQWSHMALTLSETEVSLYLNGALEAYTTLDAPVGVMLGDAYIGGWADPWSLQTEREMTGQVDDVLIYNRALSEGEVIYLTGIRLPVDPGTHGLIAAYGLDGDVSDASGNDGTVMGNPGFVEGVVGQALDLDGVDDYVDCGNTDGMFDLAEQITVAAWVNIRSLPTGWSPVVVKGENAWRLATNNTLTSFQFAINYWQTTPDYGVNGATEIGFDEWHHVCGTYDGATIALYIDGQLDGTTANDLGIDISTTNMWIGGNPEITYENRFWDGQIDEVHIYNRALTTGEIRYLAGFEQ